MSKKVICAIAATLFILAGLFPPWTPELDAGPRLRSERSVGLHIIFSPPEPQSLQQRFYPEFGRDMLNFFSVRIDSTRLLIEWACILMGGVAAWIITTPKRAREQQREPSTHHVEKTAPIAPKVEPRILSKAKNEQRKLPDSVQSRLYVRMNEYLNDHFPNSDREAAGEHIYPKLLQRASQHTALHGNLDGFSIHAALKEESEACLAEFTRRKSKLATEGTPPRIVMVNDEPCVMEMIEILIRQWRKHAIILTFTDPEKALAELLRTEPDLLITDDSMPRLSGAELVERLTGNNVRYPIVVTSLSELTEQWVKEFASRGLNITLLAQPFTVEQAKQALFAHLGPKAKQ